MTTLFKSDLEQLARRVWWGSYPRTGTKKTAAFDDVGIPKSGVGVKCEPNEWIRWNEMEFYLDFGSSEMHVRRVQDELPLQSGNGKSYTTSLVSLRMVRDGSVSLACDTVTSPEEGARVMYEFLSGRDREHMAVLMLDTKNHVQGVHVAFVGSLNAAIITNREIFKAAVLHNSAAIIIGHNHPSGEPTPSPEDVRVTRNIREAGRILDIEVLDHIVVGDDGRWTSMREEGMGFE